MKKKKSQVLILTSTPSHLLPFMYVFHVGKRFSQPQAKFMSHVLVARVKSYTDTREYVQKQFLGSVRCRLVWYNSAEFFKKEGLILECEICSNRSFFFFFYFSGSHVKSVSNHWSRFIGGWWWGNGKVKAYIQIKRVVYQYDEHWMDGYRIPI